MIFLTHICKYSLRINSGFFTQRKELHMNTYNYFGKFSSIYPTGSCGGLIALSLLLDPRVFLLFSVVPGFHHHGLRLRLTH